VKINGIQISPTEAAGLVHQGSLSMASAKVDATKEELTAYYARLNTLTAPKDADAARDHARKLASVSSLLRSNLAALVTDQDAVQVHTRMEHGIYLLRVSVNPMDRGRVLGKKFRSYHALKTLAQAAAGRLGLAVDLEVDGWSEGRAAGAG
jgi:predicted RNA-binding protein YlqC (UPF0109 family)